MTNVLAAVFNRKNSNLDADYDKNYLILTWKIKGVENKENDIFFIFFCLLHFWFVMKTAQGMSDKLKHICQSLLQEIRY